MWRNVIHLRHLQLCQCNARLLQHILQHIHTIILDLMIYLKDEVHLSRFVFLSSKFTILSIYLISKTIRQCNWVSFVVLNTYNMRGALVLMVHFERFISLSVVHQANIFYTGKHVACITISHSLKPKLFAFDLVCSG